MSVIISYVMISMIILSGAIFAYTYLYPKIVNLKEISQFEFEKKQVFLLDKIVRDLYYEGGNSSRIFELELFKGNLRIMNNSIVYKCTLRSKVYDRYIDNDRFRNLSIVSIRGARGYDHIISIKYNFVKFSGKIYLRKGRYKLFLKNYGNGRIEIRVL